MLPSPSVLGYYYSALTGLPIFRTDGAMDSARDWLLSAANMLVNQPFGLELHAQAAD